MRTGSKITAMTGPGRLLRALGFRWVFPIGTLPLPYHPLIGLGFLLAPPLWIASLAVSGVRGAGALLWWHPLIVALVLGLLMSIPFVSWAMMVFRAPLAQAVLITGAMTLLAIDVATGRAALAWAVLPAGFVLLYAVQRIGGLSLLRQLQREAAAWTPVDPGSRTVIAIGATAERARNLVDLCDVVRAVAADRMVHRLTPAGVAALREACDSAPPPGWSLPDDGAAPIVVSPAGESEDGLRLASERWRSRLVRGELHRVRAGADRSVIWGAAQIAGRIPVFTAFHWTAIVGRSSWHIGFMPDRPVRLGPETNDYRRLDHVLTARPGDGGRTDDAGPLIERIAADAAAERVRIDAFWQAIAADPDVRADSEVMRRLSRVPALIRPGDGQRLIAWLAAAKAARLRTAVHSAAFLLERLPDPHFAAVGAELLIVLNSRILAGEWRIEPGMDLSDVPRDCPRFGHHGGFALMRTTPKLYDRLAMLGAAERRMVEALRVSLA